MKNISVILCLSLLFCCSCSEKYEDSIIKPRPATGKVTAMLPIAESFEEASIYSSEELPMTRTQIIGDGNLDRVGWAETDKVALWATPEGGVNYVLNGETFTYYSPLQGNALFTANIAAMNPETYIYYGAYPLPKATDGTRVSYTLPTEQNGTYDGRLDIMLARPTSGCELTEQTPLDGARLSFAHKCHVMRIQVPTGRNKWGVKVRKLRIKFPAEVVGDLQFDVTAPDAEPVFTNGSNTITLNLKRQLDESAEEASDGNYVWVFVRPGVTLDGNLEFTAYSEEGYQSETLYKSVSKTLAAGRITPITMSIPQELPVTYFDLSIGTNNLGEAPTTFTITAPQGVLFRGGKGKQTFTANAANKYELAFYHTFDGLQNGESLRTGTSSFVYESQSAIVADTQVLGGTITPSAHNACALTVPYLMFENFKEMNWSGKNETDTEDLSSHGMAAGWKAGMRMQCWAGVCVVLRQYNNWAGGPYYSRLDAAPLTGLKEGKSVNIKMVYNSSNNNDTIAPRDLNVNVGLSTGTDQDSGISNGQTITVWKNKSSSQDNIPEEYTVNMTGATNQQHIAWKTAGNNYGGIRWNYEQTFIDNIRVSIVK